MSTTSKTDNKPGLHAVRPPAPTPITALVPPEIKPAIDALTRIQLGTGTPADLAEIALTVHGGRTTFARLWFLEAVTEALKELQNDIRDASYTGRWEEAAFLRAREQSLFQRLKERLARDLPKCSGEPG